MMPTIKQPPSQKIPHIQRDSSFQSLHMSQASNTSDFDIEQYNDDDDSEDYEYQTDFGLQRSTFKITETVSQAYKNSKSKFKTMTTNLLYNIKNSKLKVLSQRQKVVLNKQQPIFLLGKMYSNEGSKKEEFYQKFMEIIWLSYRHGICNEIESDAGWGCMIRVCQMVLAEVFKRLFVDKGKFTAQQMLQNYFRDSPESLISLSRICRKGNIKQRWTSSIEVFSILRDIIEELQQGSPNKSKLGFCSYSHNSNFNDTPSIFQQSISWPYPSVQVHTGFIQIQNLSKQLNAATYPNLVFISNRLSDSNKIHKAYTDSLLALMNIKYFAGAIGGEGGDALYLVGHYDRKLIFFDPHYVQPAEQNNQAAQFWQSEEIDDLKHQKFYSQSSKQKSPNKTKQSYYQSQPYSIPVDQLAPSVAFNYLVSSKEEHQDLLIQLYQLQIKYDPDVCLQVISEQIAKKAAQKQKKRKKYDKNIDQDDDFEVLE